MELLLRTAAGERARDALRGAIAAAPSHVDAEVLSALRRLARLEDIDDELVRPALHLLARSPIRRLPLPPLLEDAWALRESTALRDALYVTAARRLGATLLTADGRLARASGLGVTVTLVAG